MNAPEVAFVTRSSKQGTQRHSVDNWWRYSTIIESDVAHVYKPPCHKYKRRKV